jgi:two-component system, oxyanion-binding sensor
MCERSFEVGMTDGSNGTAPTAGAATPTLRVGFIPQLESAPLIAARELGLFSEEKLNVQLVRHVSWSAVRDGLVFGQLDAAQALAGFPLISQLGREWFAEPLVSLLTLGMGGGSLVLSNDLWEAGVTSSVNLARWLLLHRSSSTLMLAHTFSCSPHRYLLRDWLVSAGIHPDRDVRLTTVAPPLLVEQLAKGYLNGFFAGDPLGALAERDGAGHVVMHGNEILPDHPNQALVVSQRWLERHPGGAQALARAVLRAGAWCEDPANRRELSLMMAPSDYLNVSADLLEACLFPGQRTFSPAALFPSKMHAAWLLMQMIRWGELSPGADIATIAERCCDATAYRSAAAELGIEAPADDFPPMELGGGEYLTRGQLVSPVQRAAM